MIARVKKTHFSINRTNTNTWTNEITFCIFFFFFIIFMDLCTNTIIFFVISYRWATTTAIGSCWIRNRLNGTANGAYRTSKRGVWGPTNIWTTNNFWCRWTGKPSRTVRPLTRNPKIQRQSSPQSSRLRRKAPPKKCTYLNSR